MTPEPSKQKIDAAVKAYVENDGPRRSWSSLCKQMGYATLTGAKAAIETWAPFYNIEVPPRQYEALSGREKRAIEFGHRTAVRKANDAPVYTLPQMPSPDLPIDEIISRLSEDSKRRIEANAAREWARIQINVDGPYILLFWGDPHLDDDGCAFHVVQQHVAEAKANKYIINVGLGDYQNNWVGRLARLYANQETSARTAWRLVEWWIREVRPALLIKGNHDLWSGAGDPLDWMVRQSESFTEDWLAKVEFVSPNGKSCRLWAAHDFKGTSMWNPLHSNQRKARESGARAHLYVAGHRHEWGCATHEDPDSGHVYTLLRARGYKVLDSYAEQSGFGSQRYGHSIAVVVDPDAIEGDRFITPFINPIAASQYLRFLRWE